jgi:hypothetical protein
MSPHTARLPAVLFPVAMAGMAAACQPALQMDPGTPIVIKRGYCFANTAYVQAGRERNPADTRTQLAKYEEAKPHVTSGRILSVSSGIGAVAGGSMVGIGLAGAMGSPEMPKGASTALIASGAALAALSIGLCIVGEGQYESAVEAYNARLLTKGAATDVDDGETDADSGEDKSPDVGASSTGARGNPVESSPP